MLRKMRSREGFAHVAATLQDAREKRPRNTRPRQLKSVKKCMENVQQAAEARSLALGGQGPAVSGAAGLRRQSRPLLGPARHEIDEKECG